MSENKNEKKDNEIVVDLSNLGKFAVPGSIILSALIISASILIASNTISSSKTVSTTSDTTSTVTQPTSVQELVEVSANSIGLNGTEILSCASNSKDIQDLIDTHSSDAANSGISGTPGFIVGKIVGDNVEGILVPGAFPYSVFKDLIDAYIAEDKTAIENLEKLIASQAQIPQGESLKKVTPINNAGFKGNSSKVAVVEYLDITCGFCKRHFAQTFPELEKNYISNNKIAYYKKQFPILSDNSRVLASGAECVRQKAGNDKFFEMMSLLLK